MSKTIEMLKNYIPYNEQEKEDLSFFIEAESRHGDILTRDNKFCHLTASAFIVNPEKTKVLCIYHNIYNSWGWVGGHADGDDDMLYVAKKETSEETSLKHFTPINEMPISIEVLPVWGHVKRGKYVSAHTHLNVTFLLEADENETIHILEGENSNIGWLTFVELLEKSDEPYMIPVYKKIIEKIKKRIY
ncbi:MAG: NUDIX hydrolase [Clostridia bacterium]|nr:NUDIX hydrolase [Clostridia bacterium]